MNKVLVSFLLAAFLTSCNNVNNSSTSNSSSSLITTSSISEVSSAQNNSSSSEISSSTSKVTSSQSSSIFTSSSSKVISSQSSSKTSKNPDGSDVMEAPSNEKIVLGSDNASMTSFDFYNSLPDSFRFIYGNNFTNPPFYSETAGGGLKISNFTNAKQGFQTCLFEGNKKLEIRLNIGNLYNNSMGNKIDKSKPVCVIYGFNDFGQLIRNEEITTIDKNDENKFKRVYMDGNDVSYLEFRFLQPAYKSSQGYNISIMGLDLIAWPYDL